MGRLHRMDLQDPTIAQVGPFFWLGFGLMLMLIMRVCACMYIIPYVCVCVCVYSSMHPPTHP